MSRRVIVIGGGVAGFGAALGASEAGAEVTLVAGAAGATSLGPGAWDDQPWEVAARAATTADVPLRASIDPPLRSALRHLDHLAVPEEGAPCPQVVTTAGTVRSTLARDAALLDLRALAGRTLLVLAAARTGWDERSLARAIADGAGASGASVEASQVSLLRYDDEHTVSDADLAARFDDEARCAWLVAQLRPVVKRFGPERVALLSGPWLGLRRPRAATIAEALGCPVGEALSAISPTAGLRWEAARDRALDRLGVTVERGWAASVREERGRPRVGLEGDRELAADALVGAIGGLVSGGLVYDPPEHGAGFDGPRAMRQPFRASLAGLDVVVGWGDHGLVSSTRGPVLDDVAWPRGGRPGALEGVGVTAGPSGHTFVAGDFAVNVRRTLLGALRSGLAAGRRAAGGA